MVPPTQCFLSYAHHDHQGFDCLLVNLKPYAHLYGIKLWHDRGITAGSYWGAKIKAEIARSQIFVLLTSNDFLGSEYVLKHKFPAIIDRHQTANALVVPVATGPSSEVLSNSIGLGSRRKSAFPGR
jgi:hypothetical protein